ncbi:uncharacterized protein FOMMEDRAFT_154228 [Fomitiporia mediterranea MF3/22]|uniref:uncharacterized protein n=1 Tax=Fomitiporia mediterranea (strain MF3/22) TaxID=694068 RepID=UPI0004408A38|nr:uncharacterized protein FOMMEDRAFT_154228 [Fomitiporia mediterranea MF3/22]EJD05058.1 hypothetical protein FOMMEDRAFT_154228 [Fomitiporia mediterranea MF3/22]
MSSDQQTNWRLHNEVDQILADLQYLNMTGLVQYDSQRPVAQGGYGNIYRGHYLLPDSTLYPVTIKCLRVYMDGGRDVVRVFKRKIRPWSRLAHCNILPLAGYMLEEASNGSPRLPSLVSSWMDNGNARSMAEGLAYLHANNIVHSDFKSAMFSFLQVMRHSLAISEPLTSSTKPR